MVIVVRKESSILNPPPRKKWYDLTFRLHGKTLNREKENTWKVFIKGVLKLHFVLFCCFGKSNNISNFLDIIDWTGLVRTIKKR